MPHSTSHGSSGSDGKALDLSDIFIGREQQIDLFNIYLDRWQQYMSAAAPDDTLITIAPSPSNKLQGLIVLLYGRGGFGKSTLLLRYYEIAQQSSRHLIFGKPVDWEFAIEGKRGLFSPPEGQELDAAEYYHAL